LRVFIGEIEYSQKAKPARLISNVRYLIHTPKLKYTTDVFEFFIWKKALFDFNPAKAYAPKFLPLPFYFCFSLLSAMVAVVVFVPMSKLPALAES
jgi:hypothetical protein